ncbi:MAG: extracellular catalytic domain type 2 short-chain-length polyhydroxyalkanoate depolymerase [Zoogloea sp.]|uniref:extracellular catalytic domain type 2 short-chain-length polyhydroxyalkanoate depolymerase n=1 Tax=Zoogloea sp. TaxID=49181 RepID=UPI003F3BC82F
MSYQAPPLPSFKADLAQSSVSGLSSGAFMTVQLHLAHSSTFTGAGIIAGGPYRCAETFRGAAPITEDAWIQNANYLCMAPLIPQLAPDPMQLADMARATARDGLIDPVEHLKDQRLYIFTGTEDAVVSPWVVNNTRRFYEELGVPAAQILFVNKVPAGHSIITDNPEDNPLGANQPPYLNYGGYFQSHDILRQIYGDLNPPAERLTGRIIRFNQKEFFDDQFRASMSDFGYAYVPRAVEEGAPCRVHIALHGCNQGYAYVPYAQGQAAVKEAAPYGNRYYTTTGYNEIADSNNIVVLYPQAGGSYTAQVQNPEGCWDWWGYTSRSAARPDYYSRNAIQIQAIYQMLQRIGGQ